MPTYRLHNWNYHVWDGPAPGFVHQHVSTHTRPGAVGATHAKLGVWGDPFQARLKVYYATFVLAQDARKLIVEPLLDASLVKLWWESIDYSVRYQTLYKVLAIADIQTQSILRYVGSGLNLVNPTELVATITLQPHAGV